jgi:inorganic phosphate transporter, PiT family
MNWILIIGVITAMYMAFNIAANDIGNSMGTVVGSGALTMRKALILGALFEFLGALFLGSTVIKTVGSGIVPLEFMTGLGAFIITVSAGIWITITLIKKIPISGSDAIVSSVIGYGLVYAGFNHLQWTTIGYIMASWVVSPLIGLASGYLVYYLLKKGYLNRIKSNIGAKDRTEKVFSYFQIGSSSFAALGVGAIDIAAATGVLYVTVGPTIGFSIKFLGAIALVLGILIAGNRITGTIGRRITELVPTRGFSAQISAGSITILFASIGLPISPTQTLVGSVIGVGMARGTATVKLDVIKHIATTWIITIPACIAISGSLYFIITALI